MSSIIRTATIILVIAGLGFLGYNYLSRNNSTDELITRQDLTDTSKMGAEVLSALNQLKTLKLDAGVFSDKTFTSLTDFSKPLNPEPVGRTNPFSPVGVENAGSVKINPAPALATSTKVVGGN